MADGLLATLVLLPAVLTLLLKSNAAISFLALCGGFAVITLSGSDIQHLIGKTKITSLTSNDASLILLLVPLFLTLLLTFRSSTGHKLRLLQLVPALCAGGLLAAVAAPMFSSGLNTNLSDSQLWKDLQNIQSYIVSAGLLASLLLIWSNGLSPTKPHHKKHK
jgi:hypothetical protein